MLLRANANIKTPTSVSICAGLLQSSFYALRLSLGSQSCAQDQPPASLVLWIRLETEVSSPYDLIFGWTLSPSSLTHPTLCVQTARALTRLQRCDVCLCTEHTFCRLQLNNDKLLKNIIVFLCVLFLQLTITFCKFNDRQIVQSFQTNSIFFYP